MEKAFGPKEKPMFTVEKVSLEHDAQFSMIHPKGLIAIEGYDWVDTRVKLYTTRMGALNLIKELAEILHSEEEFEHLTRE